MAVQAPTKVVRDYLNDSRVWADFMAQGGFVEGDIVVSGCVFPVPVCGAWAECSAWLMDWGDRCIS